MRDSFFNQIEKKTGLNFEEIVALANAISYADFSDEKQVKKIVRKVSKVANKPVSKELEEKIISSIVNDGHQLNLDQIEKMISKK